MKNDRPETRNLIRENRGIAKELEKMYAAWTKRVNVVPYDKLLKIREKIR